MASKRPQELFDASFWSKGHPPKGELSGMLPGSGPQPVAVAIGCLQPEMV
jgi:hypothetical protein